MMPEQDIFNIVRVCFQAALQLEHDELQTITRDTTASDLEKWTSLTHVALILQLEDTLEIEFDDFEIVELVSVDAILDSIEGKINE